MLSPDETVKNSRTIVLRGFYGKGNMGDEALLRSILSHLGQEFNYKISVNTPGTPKDDWRKRFPYSQHTIISSLARGKVMSPEVSTFFLGGGGLGLGFGYDQLICARRAGKAFIHSGVHIHDDFFEGKDKDFLQATRSMLLLANMTTVRDKFSLESLNKYDIPGEFLPDWAFGLESEVWSPPVPEKYVVVTFRRRPPNDAELIKPWLFEMQRFIEALGAKMVVLPFDKGDAMLTKMLGFSDLNVPDLYFSPEKAKYLISKALAVVSFGRFHPIVFGLSEHVPTFSVDYWYAKESKHKTSLLLREEGFGDSIFHQGNFVDFTSERLMQTTHEMAGALTDGRFNEYKAMIDQSSQRMRAIANQH